MRDISIDPDFKIQIWANDEQIDLRIHGSTEELRPVEFHVKEDGAINDKPSFCFVLVDAHMSAYRAEITERMMAPALEAMGYIKT